LFRGKRSEHDALARQWIIDYHTYSGNDDAAAITTALSRPLPYDAVWGDKISFHEGLKQVGGGAASGGEGVDSARGSHIAGGISSNSRCGQSQCC